LKKNIFFALIYLSLFASCTSVFYQPDSYLYARPDQMNIEYEDLFFYGQDKTRLHAWHLKNNKKAKKSKGLVIFFHGNAQNLSSHFVSLSWMIKHGFDVFIFDYRGYGLSQGEANGEGIALDAVSALQKGHQIYKKGQYEKLIVVGQSLGGNILMSAHQKFDSRNDIDLLVLDSTFLSFKKVANKKMRSLWPLWPLSPLAYLFISDRYCPNDYVSQIETPTLVIHGKKDGVIPFEFGEEVYKEIQAPNKWFWSVDEGRHINVFAVDNNRYQKEFLELIERL
jgi:uncharacterized protein